MSAGERRALRPFAAYEAALLVLAGLAVLFSAVTLAPLMLPIAAALSITGIAICVADIFRNGFGIVPAFLASTNALMVAMCLYGMRVTFLAG